MSKGGILLFMWNPRVIILHVDAFPSKFTKITYIGFHILVYDYLAVCGF